MSKNIFELSDCLFSCRREFLKYENTGVFLSPENVRILTETLYSFGFNAQMHEHEISRLRWNSMRQSEDKTLQDLRDELYRPGSNLVLFKPDLVCREA